MLLILPIDVKEGRSSTMVSASSSWTYKKALKKRKLTASQMYVFHHIIRTHSCHSCSLTVTSWGPLTSGVTLHVNSSSGRSLCSSTRHSLGAIFTWTSTGLLHCSCVESRLKDRVSGFGKNTCPHSEEKSTHGVIHRLLDSLLSSWFIYIKLTFIQRSVDGLCCLAQTGFGLGKHSSFFSNA